MENGGSYSVCQAKGVQKPSIVSLSLENMGTDAEGEDVVRSVAAIIYGGQYFQLTSETVHEFLSSWLGYGLN